VVVIPSVRGVCRPRVSEPVRTDVLTDLLSADAAAAARRYTDGAFH
jgi:hypothetical protein